jgi:hypothetical protein
MVWMHVQCFCATDILKGECWSKIETGPSRKYIVLGLGSSIELALTK